MRRVAFITVIGLVLLLCGCSDYHADIPKYTDVRDRDTGFIPKADSKQTTTDNEALENKVRQGLSDVEEKANLFSSEIGEESRDIKQQTQSVEDAARAAKGSLGLSD